MYMGVQPFLAAVLCCILITLFSMILLGGFTAKTFSAIAGTTIGCVVSGLIAFIFAYFMHINGYNVEEVETLILIEQNSQLQAGGLLFQEFLLLRWERPWMWLCRSHPQSARFTVIRRRYR